MKNINKFLIGLAGCAALTLSGCMEETFPTDLATKEQALDAPDALAAAMPAFMVKRSVIVASHWDFGYPSHVIMTELMGQDVVSTLAAGYEQFGSWIRVQSLTKDYTTTQFTWNFWYGLVKAANGAIDVLKEGATSDSQKAALAAAYTYRAFAYFNLANAYQYTYKGNETKPAVPIVLETTTEEEAGNNPRATVQAVYDLILEDLGRAEATFPATYKTADVADVDLSVMYGIYARVYLSMENWAKAKDYAKKAQAGYSMLTQTEYLSSSTGFNSMDSQSSWIWGLHYTTEDGAVQTGICNFTSMMCNDYAAGYTGAPSGPMKMINAQLYSKISDKDWRKSTWTATAGVKNMWGGSLPQYAARKFRPMGGDPYNSQQATDFPLMRVEEMILIEAEATAMGGDLAGAKTILNGFLAKRSVNTADPMTSQATTAKDFQDEVWMQRRIELWGEGFSFIDIKRLGKGITRSYVGTNQIAPYRYNTTDVPYWFVIMIVRNEEANNKALEGNNNPDVPTPKDVDPLKP